MLAVSDRPTLRTQIIQQINAILLHIKNSFLQFFNALGDLIYKVIFEGPMGQWIMTMIIKICEFLNWVYNNIIQRIVCWAREVVLFALDFANGVVDVLNKIAMGGLGSVKKGISDAKTEVRKSLTCNNRNPLDCNISFRNDPPLTTTLPLPTRCWAGVEPGVNSFSCTAADTCMDQDLSNVICGACTKASAMIQFGCNTLTKLCSCNVFSQDTSFCSSHEECTMDNANVECEFVDSYLEPSYGHIPCKQCPKPICLISDGSGRGKCTCLLRPIPNQGCIGLGERVSPNAASLCLIATAGGGQGSSSTYTQTYRTLASVPCMLINQATSYCMQVYTSATASSPMVVGLSLLKTTGRRLLENSTFISQPQLLLSDSSEWEGEGEPCKTLVMANASMLGILEKYTLGECWRWRDVGVRLISESNMTGIRPTFMVSWQDLLNAMLNEGAVPEILGKLPSVIHSLLIHMDAIQPVYISLLYWSSYLPQDLWTNQTILDQARLYLLNMTHPLSQQRRLLSVDDENEGIKTPKVSEWHEGPYQWIPNHIHWNLPGERRLLSQQPTVEAEGSVNTAPSANTVYEWSQGPYTWPPNFNYWQGKDSCAVVSTAINVVKNGLDVTMKFYQNTPPEPQKVGWPSLPINSNANLQLSMPNVSDVTGIILHYTDQVLNRTSVSNFLDEAPYAKSIKSLVQCNFTRIQTCEDRYDLLWSVIQVSLMLLVIGIVGKLLEVPYIEAILILFFLPLVMYSAYGYALTCAPLIPTCALQDLLAILEYFIPESIEWPDALVTKPGCREVSCMRSCVNEPYIGFASWQDHLAWIMCEIDSAWCNKVANSLALDDPLRTAIKNKYYYDGTDPESTRAARRICFAVTLANSVPFLLLGLLLLSLLPSVIGVCIAAAQFALNTLLSFVIFVHGQRREG